MTPKAETEGDRTMREDEGTYEDFEPGAQPSEWEGAGLPDWHEEPEAGGSGGDASELWIEKEAAERRRQRREARTQAARSGLYGPIAQVAAEADLGGLGALSPDAAGERLHRAGRLLEDLSPEHRDDAHRYLQAQATKELRAAWGDWRSAEAFLRDHLPAPMGGHAPYGPDGVLRAEDVRTMDLGTPFLIEGAIPAGSVGILTAPFGVGKTFATIGLGLSIAYGESWLDLETADTGPVRFVAAEGRTAFPKRLAGWLAHHGHLPESFTRAELAEALEGRAVLTAGILRLDDPQLERTLLRTVEVEGTRLLVLDTLGRLLGADQSDADNDTANRVMGTLHRVASETGVTVLLVHHPGHAAQERSRGASAWEQAADFVFTVRGSPSDVRDGRTLTLRNRKQRDAELAEDVGYRLQSLTVECDGETWETAVVGAGPILREIPLAERIRAVVQKHPGSSLRFVRSNVQGKAKETGEEIDRLVGAGRLEDRGKGSRYALHDVPDKWPEEPSFEADEEPADLSDLTGDTAPDPS